MVVNYTACCGLDEIDLLGLHKTPEKAMALLKHAHPTPSAMFLFTGVTKRRVVDHTGTYRTDDYGRAFARFVKAAGLGHVVGGKATINPETGNTIRAWVWTVNRPAYRAWGSPRGKQVKS